jgi:teichuronic acid biosynthesis glycosyltransferase TuaC
MPTSQRDNGHARSQLPWIAGNRSLRKEQVHEHNTSSICLVADRMTQTISVNLEACLPELAAARAQRPMGRGSPASVGPKRLRIAVVTPMLPVPHDLTRGRFTYETVRGLAKLADVRVFFQNMRYPRLPGMKPRSFIHGKVGPDYKIEGLDVEAFDFPAVPVLSRGLNGLVGSWALRPRVRAFKPDLVLAYWVYPDGNSALRVARSLGVPCVIGALGSDIHVRSGLNVILTRRTLRGADAVVTVSEAMRQAVIDDYGVTAQRVHTVVNGFNTAIFGPADQAEARNLLGIDRNDQVVVYVGRFIEAKGLRELIDASCRVAELNQRFRLVLIGDGVMKAELMELVQRSGLKDRVLLPGGLPPKEVARWICASDILTLPSWSEGYPNVVVEAIACGRPVVATDVGGTREIVDASNGILVQPRNPEELAGALQSALKRQWNHAGIAAAMRRSWDDVAADTLKVCTSLVSAISDRTEVTSVART